MKILGVDTGSKNIGVSVLDTDNMVISYYNHCSLRSRIECFNWFTSLLKETVPDKVFLEKPYYSFNSKHAQEVTEYIAIMKLVADQALISVECISPKTAKKQFTGNGNASKQVIIDKVKEVFNLEIDNDHITDSIAIAYAGSKQK